MKIRLNGVFFAFLLIALVFTGCGGGGSESIIGPAATLRPGEFQVSIASNLKGSVKTTSADFDLGSLKATQSFYFVLNNSGDIPITGISLAVDNAAFEVYPQKIDQLANSSNVAAVPIISIKAKHGQTAGTVGHVPTLAPGDLKTKIEISGKTKSAEGEEITLLHALNLSSFVHYADIKLIIDGLERNLTKPNYSSGITLGDGTSVKCYIGAKPVIQNTGNTDLRLEIFDNQPIWLVGSTKIREATISPGQAYTEDFSGTTNNEVVIRIDTLGVVYDTERLKGHTDGYVYFVLDRE